MVLRQNMTKPTPDTLQKTPQKSQKVDQNHDITITSSVIPTLSLLGFAALSCLVGCTILGVFWARRGLRAVVPTRLHLGCSPHVLATGLWGCGSEAGDVPEPKNSCKVSGKWIFIHVHPLFTYLLVSQIMVSMIGFDSPFQIHHLQRFSLRSR